VEEDVILNKIIEDAQKEANEIIENAKQEAQRIELENTNRITKQTQEKLEIMKAKVEKDMSADMEKAEFDARNAVLIAKKKIIDIVKEKVKQKIQDLENSEYIKLIDEKISKYKSESNVEILLPKKCYSEIKAIASSYGMTVLEENDDFDSGVIVKCGNIEYNYNFEENMDFMNEEIEKEIDSILFNN